MEPYLQIQHGGHQFRELRQVCLPTTGATKRTFSWHPFQSGPGPQTAVKVTQGLLPPGRNLSTNFGERAAEHSNRERIMEGVCCYYTYMLLLFRISWCFWGIDQNSGHDAENVFLFRVHPKATPHEASSAGKLGLSRPHKQTRPGSASKEYNI